MKKVFFIVLNCLILASAINGQVSPPVNQSRPRIVGASTPIPQPKQTPTPQPNISESDAPAKKVVVTDNLPPKPVPTPTITPRPTPTVLPTPPAQMTVAAPAILNPYPPLNFKHLTLGELKGKIAEAKRLLQANPLPTATADSFLLTDIVRIGFYDWKNRRIDFVPMTKESFLRKDGYLATRSSNGKDVIIRTHRSNFVNTALVIYDLQNQLHTPLVVQYPIEKFGRFTEMAYYISNHPGLSSPETIAAGQLYIRNTIDAAREKLRLKGFMISPQIADIAERLATVEHVDHDRFRNELHLSIYHDVFTLFALNQGDTYRYSVSTAGAGGMVQMIPSTYAMVRNRYYSVGLIPDFVAGMRDHLNASQAMLLYMQWTWNDLAMSDTVNEALISGIATQADLMAAGYNSNPARLPLYIRRGGANWRSLIPRETKIYLQIYASLERNVPMIPRAK